MTREERRDSFVRWGTFIVSAVALVVASLRDPIVWTLRATIQEQLRAELGKYETISSASAKWAKHSDLGDELTKRLDHDLTAIQDAAAAARTNEVLLRELGRRLSQVETNFQDFRRDFLVSQKSEGRNMP